MPRAKARIEELLKGQMHLTTPTFWNARGGKGFPSGGPGGYLAATLSKLNRTLLYMRVPV